VAPAAVEALAGELWPGRLCAVATAKDERKGERLVMITDAPEATRTQFMEYAKGKGAMDLMVPADVRVVERVPVLGSGKVDFAGVETLVRAGTPAAERVAG